MAAQLERLRKAGDASYKEIVNEALRRGLREMASRPKRRTTFRTQAVSLGRCKIASIDNISEALAVAEEESFK